MNTTPAAPTTTRRQAHWALAVLTVVYAMNLSDRQIMGVLIEPKERPRRRPATGSSSRILLRGPAATYSLEHIAQQFRRNAHARLTDTQQPRRSKEAAATAQ
jgi:hypothetical protein